MFEAKSRILNGKLILIIKNKAIKIFIKMARWKCREYLDFITAVTKTTAKCFTRKNQFDSYAPETPKRAGL